MMRNLVSVAMSRWWLADTAAQQPPPSPRSPADAGPEIDQTRHDTTGFKAKAHFSTPAPPERNRATGTRPLEDVRDQPDGAARRSA